MLSNLQQLSEIGTLNGSVSNWLIVGKKKEVGLAHTDEFSWVNRTPPYYCMHYLGPERSFGQRLFCSIKQTVGFFWFCF